MALSNIGWHDGEVISVGLVKAGTGSIQIVVALKDEEENTIQAFLSLSDNALPYTIKKLVAMHWDPADYDFDFAKLNEHDCSLVGMRDFKFEVTEAKDLEGVPRRKVGWIGVGGGSIVERMPENEAKAFSASLRAKLIAKHGKPAAKKPTKAPWEK